MKKRKFKHNKASSSIKSIIIRYLLMILVAIPNLWLFYLIFTPLTTYPVLGLLKLFFTATIDGTTIVVNKAVPVELIPACIAGAAYYLLFILNMAVPDVKIIKRIKMVTASFLSLLLLNILRIFFLSVMLVNGCAFFDAAHRLLWYGISTVFVVGIWFANVKIFGVKTIPFYSDVKFLYDKFIKRK
jgi:exosortase/archaeosortase family protein